MNTVKKLFLYFILFIGFFAYVTIFSKLSMRDSAKDIDYVIDTQNIKIEVEEAVATNTRGHIKGIAINETGKLLNKKLLKFDFYNKDNVLLGTKTQEIKIFNVEEKTSFNIEFEFKRVSKVKIGFVDNVEDIETETAKKEIKDESDFTNIVNPVITDNEVEIGTAIAGVLTSSTCFGLLAAL